MSVTLYHNPNCGSSRTVLAALRAARIEPTIIEYLKVQLDVEALRSLVTHMGVPVREIIRQKEPVYRDLGLDDPKLSDTELLEAVVSNPILINRPIVVTETGGKVCRLAALINALIAEIQAT